jgi:threonyl-tRNA synthetase
LIEHYKGAFPLWLAPVQVILLPIADRNLEYANDLASRMREKGFRVKVDGRNEKVGLKIRQAQLEKIPFMLILGDREERDGTVSLRVRNQGETGTRSVSDFLEELSQLAEEKALKP